MVVIFKQIEECRLGGIDLKRFRLSEIRLRLRKCFYKEHLWYGFSFLTLLLVIGSFNPVLSSFSHLYQHVYRAWDVDYAKLGTDEVVHSFQKKGGLERRTLYRKEAYFEGLEKILDSIESYVENGGRAVEFLHESRTTYVCQIEGKPYIIKLSRKKPLLESLFFVCRHSRGAWNTADWARELGFPTFQPIALVEVGARLQFASYLLYPCAGKTLLEEKDIGTWLKPFHDVLEQQKSLSIIHPDFRAKNVIQLENGIIQYIDIDDLHRYPSFSAVYQARFAKELKRFEKNMESKDFRIYGQSS